jgi:flagellar biogenesis protein FliO
MFIILALVLVVVWVVLKFAVGATSLLIHLLIIFAVISLVMHLVSGRKA